MSLKVVGLQVDGADKDAAHARLAELLRERVPALRWVSSYRTRGGTFDFVDVFEVDDEDEDDDDVELARAALDEIDGLRYRVDGRRGVGAPARAGRRAAP